jgi:predicted enzyme related to lactoylglutathione lyase
MTSMILASGVALALAAGQGQSGVTKPPPPDVGAGRVAWFDLSTTALPQAKAFYGSLFGWTFTALEGTDMAVEIVSEGAAIGTLRAAEGPISAFNGVVYVQVPDVQAACRKAVELGGTVVPGFPFNLTDRPGAIGLVRDPSGHPVGMYSRAGIAPAPAAQ